MIDRMELTNGSAAVAPAVSVMIQAAEWLIERGHGLWRLDDLTVEGIMHGVDAQCCWCLRIDGQPAAAMLLTWHDPIFWPHIPAGSCGYVHKLAVARDAHGLGLSRLMLSSAATICQRQGIRDLRLDCAADRPALARIYTSLGFTLVERRMHGAYDTAFYHRRLV